MELDPILTRILAEIDPSAIPMIDQKGMLTVKLNRALYGLVQSSLLWYKKLRAALESMGFVSNDYDACVFNRGIGVKQITVAVNVDDQVGDLYGQWRNRQV